MSLLVNIKKRIGDFFLDTSFVTDGGVTGLLGASGSGKSMTLMSIAGIVKPDSGKIVLNGRTLFDSEKNINLTPQQRRIGYLFQNYALFPNMTVRQNILCGMSKEKDKKMREHSLNSVIELMQLKGLEKRRPSQLSGGQQQRAALARILVGNPDVLILDEPFSALDSYLRGQLQIEAKKHLAQFGKDAILVTHNRNEAYHLCDKIAVIDAGRIIVHKDTKQLFANPESCNAAAVTGCKNIVCARKQGEYLVDVSAWGVSFKTSQPVKDNLCAIGIRAHYFNEKSTQNLFPIRLAGELEGPFEYIIQFRYENQLEHTPDIWWRISKEKRASKPPAALGISPSNIMLLYDA